MDIKGTSGNASPLTLNDFIDAARQGPEILVSHDGRELEVLAHGSTEGGRRVAWVNDTQADSTGIFLDTLSGAYGGPVARAVAQELGLAPSQGKPVSSRSVEQSVDMADTARIAMDGVGFMNSLFNK